MQLKAATYDQYMELLASVSPGRLQRETDLIVDRFYSKQDFPAYFTATTFFVDYISRKYIHIDKNCVDVVGHPDTYYYESGHEGFLRQTHPADYAMVNTKIFPVNLDYLKAVRPEHYPDLVFSHNFRIKDLQGQYRVILQRYSYIPGERFAQPVGVIGVALDISHFKQDGSIVHTIEETFRHKQELLNNLVYRQTYPVYEEPPSGQVSKKEREILEYLAKGFSSKEIAAKLQLSVHTVSNHRKNLLRKASCSSTAELLKYAIRHGLL